MKNSSTLRMVALLVFTPLFHPGAYMARPSWAPDKASFHTLTATRAPRLANASSQQAGATASQGMGPTCIASTKDGKYAYVGFHLSDTIFKIHLPDLVVEAVADLSDYFPIQCYRIALDANENKLFVHIASWQKMLVLDTRTLAVIHTIENVSCTGMLRSQDGRLIIWDGGNTVKFVNTDTYVITEFTDQSIGFLQIQESKSDQGKWYVLTQEGPGAPFKIGLYNYATRTWIRTSYFPHSGFWDFLVLPNEKKLYAAGVAGFYPDGNAYGWIDAVDLARWEPETVFIDGGAASLESSPDGQSLYVGVAYDYKGGSNTLVIDTQANTIRSAIKLGKTMYNAPYGEIRDLQLDSADSHFLYGVSNDANAIFRIDLNKQELTGTLVFGKENLRPHLFVKQPGRSAGYLLIHQSPNAYELDVDNATIKRLIRFPAIRADVYSYDAAIDAAGKMFICQGESFLEVDSETMGLLANHWLPPNTSLWRFVLSGDERTIYSVTGEGPVYQPNVFLAINKSDFQVKARIHLDGGSFEERPFELPDGSKVYALGGWWTGAITVHVIRTDNYTIQKTLAFQDPTMTEGISAGPYYPYAYDPRSRTLYVGASNVVLAIDTDTDVIKKVIYLRDIANAIGLAPNSIVYVNAIALVYQPRENCLYLVHLDRAFVSIYDLTNDRFLPQVIPSKGFFPWYAFANDDSSRIFVLNSRSDSVSVIDVSSKTVEKVIDLHSVISTSFAHVAVGGGYTTQFTLINTGSIAAEGDLTLVGSGGSPFDAAQSPAPVLPSFADSNHQILAGSTHINVPPGGVQYVAAAGSGAGDTTKTGWARVDGYGGTLKGVATFQFDGQDGLKATAGVISSDPVDAATIPVDNDASQNRFTGFAIANPNYENINVKLVVMNQDGTVLNAISPPELNPLGPQKQVARFLHEYLTSTSKFSGSMVLEAQGGKQFGAVALVQNQGQYAVIPVIPAKAPGVPDAGTSAIPKLDVNSAGAAGDVSTTALFPQVAIGGGYTTAFVFLNTGSTTLTGSLVLTDPRGNPLRAALSALTLGAIGSSASLSIPPGGTQFITATPANTGDPVTTGWARVESTGGSLGGVANYQLASSSGALQTTVGVLSAPTLASATIPVHDDVSQSCFTGFAVANPSDKAITIRILEVSADGGAVTALSPITLGPLSQVAKFFYEDPKAAQKFNGTVVLIGQDGASFSVMAIVQNQGLFSSIPVIPGNSPRIAY